MASNTTTTKLSTFIEEVPALRLLDAPLKRIWTLHRVYSGAVPAALSKASRVGYLDDNTVVIIAFNGTTAAGLRQRAPTLLADLKACDSQITGIRIEVQVEKFYTYSEKNGPSRHLSPDGVGSLTRLAESLPESPLRTAIQQLACHAAKLEKS